MGKRYSFRRRIDCAPNPTSLNLSAIEATPDWRPLFLDYLFLGYNTATAFSPTDALPLTRRAKMLMMLESTISLLTLVIVAARAVNVLP
jgi:hypothetical protein